MSTLSFLERRRLEDLFEMGTGYVLGFSNRTFQEFMADLAGIDIHDAKYEDNGTSKANRLRTFWTKEPNGIVADVISGLIQAAEERPSTDLRKIEEARHILDDLRRSDIPQPAMRRRARSTFAAAAPAPLRSTESRLYDVALSFAGEQRAYVSRVAEALRGAGVRVFYDEFEDLWGKDLAVELERVYHSGSRYTVVFVSEAYVAKAWTNHERQLALAGRMERRDDSLLPVHFDSARLPGFQPR